MKNRVKISVDGKSFTLMGEATEEHMRVVASYIDEKMAEVRKKAKVVERDSALAYVLTSLNVADDYFKEKERSEFLESRLRKLAQQLEEMQRQLEQAQSIDLSEEMEKRIKIMEERVEQAEKGKIEAENKLDDYLMAMERNQQSVSRYPVKTKYRKNK